MEIGYDGSPLFSWRDLVVFRVEKLEDVGRPMSVIASSPIFEPGEKAIDTPVQIQISTLHACCMST